MPTKRRLGLVKTISSQDKTLTALVSTFQWDRMQERFAKGAWDLKNYLDNPVMLWGHDASEPPIGKATKIYETPEGLVAEVQFDEGSKKAMDIFRLYKEKFLSGFSVGFIPKKWVVEPIDGNPDTKGIVFTDAELLEFSAVSIPANPGALIPREMAEFVTKALGDKAVKELEDETTHEKTFQVVGPEETEQPAAPVEPSPPAEPAPEAPPAPAPVTEPEPEKAPDGIPMPTPAPVAELEKSLRYLIDLSKTAKASKLDKAKVDLCQQAVSVLSEIVDLNREGVDSSVISKLQEAVNGYAKAIQELFPDNEVLLKKVMIQVDKALAK